MLMAYLYCISLFSLFFSLFYLFFISIEITINYHNFHLVVCVFYCNCLFLFFCLSINWTCIPLSIISRTREIFRLVSNRWLVDRAELRERCFLDFFICHHNKHIFFYFIFIRASVLPACLPQQQTTTRVEILKVILHHFSCKRLFIEYYMRGR